MLDSLKETFKSPQEKIKEKTKPVFDSTVAPPDIKPRVPLDREFMFSNRTSVKLNNIENEEKV